MEVVGFEMGRMAQSQPRAGRLVKHHLSQKPTAPSKGGLRREAGKIAPSTGLEPGAWCVGHSLPRKRALYLDGRSS